MLWSGLRSRSRPEPPGAALFEPEPPRSGGSGSGKLRKTNIIYSVLLNFLNICHMFSNISNTFFQHLLISTCHVIVYSDLMFKITNLEFSSSFIHSNLKKNHNLDIINCTTAELKWPGPEPGRSRSRQNFDPEPEPPKSRAAPQPCCFGSESESK